MDGFLSTAAVSILTILDINLNRTKEAGTSEMNEYLDPSNAKLRRALFLLGEGKAEQASSMIDECLAEDSNNAAAHRAKAMIHVRNEAFLDAEKSLFMAISSSTQLQYEHSLELGSVYINLDRIPESIRYLDEAIDGMRSAGDEWELGDALLLRAFAYYKSQEFEKARADLAVVSEECFYQGQELWDKKRILSSMPRS